MSQSTSILLGDFNCTHYSNCYKILTKGVDVALFTTNDNNADLDSEEDEEEEEEEEEDDEESLQLVNCAQGVQIETTYPGFGTAHKTETKTYGGPRDVRFGTVVDMILSSPDVTVNKFSVLNDVQLENGRRPSTHYPIVADLSL